jgi:hypothetical protein
VQPHATEVVLEYRYEQQDMTDAVRTLLRRRGRSRFVHHPAFLGCVGLVGVALVALGLTADDGTLVAFGVMFVVWPLLMSRAPAMSARRLLDANQHHGLVRASVGEAGVRMVSAHIDVRTDWANYGSYAESDRCFVLRSPDRAGYCASILVKRGARSPQDVDRLRALLDGRLRRD